MLCPCLVGKAAGTFVDMAGLTVVELVSCHYSQKYM